jgi:hypothetical protein
VKRRASEFETITIKTANNIYIHCLFTTATCELKAKGEIVSERDSLLKKSVTHIAHREHLSRRYKTEQ